jgi:hypothetical protein
MLAWLIAGVARAIIASGQPPFKPSVVVRSRNTAQSRTGRRCGVLTIPLGSDGLAILIVAALEATDESGCV